MLAQDSSGPPLMPSLPYLADCSWPSPYRKERVWLLLHVPSRPRISFLDKQSTPVHSTRTVCTRIPDLEYILAHATRTKKKQKKNRSPSCTATTAAWLQCSARSTPCQSTTEAINQPPPPSQGPPQTPPAQAHALQSQGAPSLKTRCFYMPASRHQASLPPFPPTRRRRRACVRVCVPRAQRS